MYLNCDIFRGFSCGVLLNLCICFAYNDTENLVRNSVEASSTNNADFYKNLGQKI